MDQPILDEEQYSNGYMIVLTKSIVKENSYIIIVFQTPLATFHCGVFTYFGNL